MFSAMAIKAKSSDDYSLRRIVKTNGEPPAMLPTQMDVDFLESTNAIIDKHISQADFSVDALCTLMAMSRTSFYNKLKALTGYPPADFIRLRRIEKSKTMLNSTSLTVQEIAEKCGFDDVKYFREVFRKNVGISPREYRNSAQAKTPSEPNK